MRSAFWTSGGASSRRMRYASIIPADFPPIFPYPILRWRISFRSSTVNHLRAMFK